MFETKSYILWCGFLVIPWSVRGNVYCMTFATLIDSDFSKMRLTFDRRIANFIQVFLLNGIFFAILFVPPNLFVFSRFCGDLKHGNIDLRNGEMRVKH